MLDKSLYNTVLCQSFSPCGKYLLAGSIYGQIAVFDLERTLNPTIELLTSDFNKPKYIHTVDKNVQICSMVAADKFLIVGTVGEILGWDWKSVLGSKPLKPAWQIRIPSQKSPIDAIDINSLWLSEDQEYLYAGCGDNNLYRFHLEDGKLLNSFEGHEDFVHCVHGRGNQLISASEDGVVKLWDVRTGKLSNQIEPHKNSKVNRADVGKWVGAAALSDDWIVCGGGPRLALWHIRSLDVVTVFDLPDHGIHVSYFNDDSIIAGGADKHLYQLTYSGDVKVELPVSCTTVYSAVCRTSPNTILSVAGSSPQIDLCTTLNYRDQVLYFS